ILGFFTTVGNGPIQNEKTQNGQGKVNTTKNKFTIQFIASNNFAGYELDGEFIFWCISFALTILGFFILNWTIPNRSVPIKAALIAGTFSAVVFELLKNLFGVIMSNFTSYEIVYGAFAAVPIFLLWIFLSWNIVLLGVEISY